MKKQGYMTKANTYYPGKDKTIKLTGKRGLPRDI